jgi:hypothetical protein
MAKKKNETPSAGSEANGHYEEWMVEVKPKGKYEKLKLVRSCVKISEEEAETLNAGVLNGGNSHVNMYFKPE